MKPKPIALFPTSEHSQFLLPPKLDMKFTGLSFITLAFLLLAACSIGASVPGSKDDSSVQTRHEVRGSVAKKPSGTSVLKKKPCCVLYCTSGCRCCSIDDILAEGGRFASRVFSQN